MCLPARFPADKNELGGVESFDMYVGPITSYYSQVWWTGLPAVCACASRQI
jgi:hypothetical protein